MDLVKAAVPQAVSPKRTGPARDAGRDAAVPGPAGAHDYDSRRYLHGCHRFVEGIENRCTEKENIKEVHRQQNAAAAIHGGRREAYRRQVEIGWKSDSCRYASGSGHLEKLISIPAGANSVEGFARWVDRDVVALGYFRWVAAGNGLRPNCPIRRIVNRVAIRGRGHRGHLMGVRRKTADHRAVPQRSNRNVRLVGDSQDKRKFVVP